MSFAVFDTALGACAVAWGDGGVVGVELPHVAAAKARRRVLCRHPNAGEAEPPEEIRAAIEGIVGLLAGERRDLTAVPVDLTGVGAFEQRVYAVAREIPPGQTLTYGEVAHRLGEPGAAQAVGRALARNPFPIVVPCHRVTAAGRRTGGFSGEGGVETKMRLLAIEDATISGQPLLF